MREEVLEYVKTYIESGGLKSYPDAFILLLIDFVVEKFKSRRNYPSDFTATRIETDMNEFEMTICLATVDMLSKVGAEGHTAYNEGGTNRTFENAFISLNLFADVVSFAKMF